MNYAIQLENLAKSYRLRGNKNLLSGIFNPDWHYVEAVRGVNLTIKHGELVAFLGKNGAGKTTTTKMMCGLLYPTSGNIDILGYTPFDRNPTYLKQIGMVMGQKNFLRWELSANQSYQLLIAIYELDEATALEFVDRLAQMLEVQDYLDTPVRNVSLGQRMKLELIAAMIHQPKILFLDEPTIGLDIAARKSIREFIRQINQNQKTTIILTSHDMADIENVCERVVIINDGVIGYDGSLQALKREYESQKYLNVTYSDITTVEERKGMTEITRAKNKIDYSVSKILFKEAIAILASDENVIDISVETVPLEKIIEDKFKASVIK